MIHRRTCQIAAALGIAGFALLLTMADAFAFSASFAWCSGSPSFALTDVPQDTAKLRFAMTDLRAEFSSRRRHDRLQRADGGAVRRLLLRLHRPVAAAGPGPHLRVQHQGARPERRSAGNDHDAAQVSGVTIAGMRTVCIEFPSVGKLLHNLA